MISFVVDFNKTNPKAAQRFLNAMPTFIPQLKQAELLFVVSHHNQSVLKAISRFLQQQPQLKVKLVFCAKTLAFNQQLYYALQQATKAYIWFLDPQSKLDEDKTTALFKFLKTHAVDIVEFQPKLSGISKWMPPQRLLLESWLTYDLATRKEIVAYTFPFFGNKVFARIILEQIFQKELISLRMDASSNLAFELCYLAFLEAKSYLWIKEPVVSFYVAEDCLPTFHYVLSQWKRIHNQYKEQGRYLPEIIYANVYYLMVILTGFYGYQKLNLIFKDHTWMRKRYYETLLKIQQNDMQAFPQENPYMHQTSPETNLLKAVLPINKWNKIFNLLSD